MWQETSLTIFSRLQTFFREKKKNIFVVTVHKSMSSNCKLFTITFSEFEDTFTFPRPPESRPIWRWTKWDKKETMEKGHKMFQISALCAKCIGPQVEFSSFHFVVDCCSASCMRAKMFLFFVADIDYTKHLNWWLDEQHATLFRLSASCLYRRACSICRSHSHWLVW